MLMKTKSLLCPTKYMHISTMYQVLPVKSFFRKEMNQDGNKASVVVITHPCYHNMILQKTSCCIIGK